MHSAWLELDDRSQAACAMVTNCAGNCQTAEAPILVEEEEGFDCAVKLTQTKREASNLQA
jgi:hypothetical protein